MSKKFIIGLDSKNEALTKWLVKELTDYFHELGITIIRTTQEKNVSRARLLCSKDMEQQSYEATIDLLQKHLGGLNLVFSPVNS